MDGYRLGQVRACTRGMTEQGRDQSADGAGEGGVGMKRGGRKKNDEKGTAGLVQRDAARRDESQDSQELPLKPASQPATQPRPRLCLREVIAYNLQDRTP